MCYHISLCVCALHTDFAIQPLKHAATVHVRPAVTLTVAAYASAMLAISCIRAASFASPAAAKDAPTASVPHPNDAIVMPVIWNRLMDRRLGNVLRCAAVAVNLANVWHRNDANVARAMRWMQ